MPFNFIGFINARSVAYLRCVSQLNIFGLRALDPWSQLHHNVSSTNICDDLITLVRTLLALWRIVDLRTLKQLHNNRTMCEGEENITFKLYSSDIAFFFQAP